MAYQPCPDCGTLMGWLFDASETGEGQCWKCPYCGQFWTDQQIEFAYYLMDFDNLEGDTDVIQPF